MARRRKNPKMGDVLIYAGLAGVAFLIYRELNKPKQHHAMLPHRMDPQALRRDPRRIRAQDLDPGMRMRPRSVVNLRPIVLRAAPPPPPPPGKAPAPPPPPGSRPPPPPPPKY